MSRSGYVDDYDDDLQMGRWRGMVASAIRGKRGQKLLTDMLAALDAMPVKELVIGELETPNGDVCALGALGKVRGIDMGKIDPEDPAQVAAAFDIAIPLAQEIVFMNDEYFEDRWDAQIRKSIVLTPEERWRSMRKWIAAKVRKES